MTRKQLAFMTLFGALLVVSISVVNQAVPLPIVDPAQDAQKKPVVSPSPNGVDPSSPSVSGEPLDEVQTSTTTPNTTTTNH